MQVVMIGSGNAASVIAKLILQSGHDIIQVVSRHRAHAVKLANFLNAAATDSILEISQDADIYVIAVSDDAISVVADQLHLNNKLVVHMAGAVSKEVLKNVSASYGVLWPLQSLRKEIDHIPNIPFIVDGNDQATTSRIALFASSLSKTVKVANDTERQKLHLASVVAANFANHFYALAQEFCLQEAIDFKLIIPLMIETAERIKTHAAAEMQTGPAARKDRQTMERHLLLLDNYPEIKNLYQLVSNSIMAK